MSLNNIKAKVFRAAGFTGALPDLENAFFEDALNNSKVVVDDTTPSTSASTGSIQTDGGIGVTLESFFGAGVTLQHTTTGFSLIDSLRLTNTNDSVDATFIGATYRARLSSVGKGWFGFDQTENFGRGDFIFLLNAEANNNDVALTDIVVRFANNGEIFLNLPVVGTGTSGSLWNDAGTVKVVP